MHFWIEFIFRVRGRVIEKAFQTKGASHLIEGAGCHNKVLESGSSARDWNEFQTESEERLEVGLRPESGSKVVEGKVCGSIPIMRYWH